MNHQAYLAYLKRAAAVAGLLLFAVAAVNAIVDPYRMYNFVAIEGFNAYKPGVYNRVRLLKAFEVRQSRPDSILLGSSRSHLGFNPSHARWSHLAERPYNLAFDGATTKEMYAYLIHAHSVHPLKLVLLGLDTYHPTPAAGSTRPDYDPGVLLSGKGLWPRLKVLLNELRILTSYDTLKSSMETLQRQKESQDPWLAPDGQRLGGVFFRRPDENFQKYGPRYYFDEIDKLEIGFKLEWKIPKKEIKTYPPQVVETDPVTSLGYIRKIVDFCLREGIDLKVFLTPSHVHQLEIEYLTVGWHSLEQGKRELAELIQEAAKCSPGQVEIPLYDFSGYTQVTMEALPPRGSRAEMENFWDSSHFKEHVGDSVLDVIFGAHDAARASAEPFGRRLTPDNVEAVLEEDRGRREEYRSRHPAEVAALRVWVEAYKREHEISD